MWSPSPRARPLSSSRLFRAGSARHFQSPFCSASLGTLDGRAPLGPTQTHMCVSRDESPVVQCVCMNDIDSQHTDSRSALDLGQDPDEKQAQGRRGPQGWSQRSRVGCPQLRRGADFLRNQHPHLLRPPRLTTTHGDRTGESGAVSHGSRAVLAGSQCSQRVPGLRGSRGGSCLCEMGSPPPCGQQGRATAPGRSLGRHMQRRGGRDTRGGARPNVRLRLCHLFLMNRLAATRDTLAPVHTQLCK